jgi:hypothetical protein
MSVSPMLTAAMDAMSSTVDTDHILPGYLTSILPFDSKAKTQSQSKSRSISDTYKRRTYRALSNPLLGMEVRAPGS